MLIDTDPTRLSAAVYREMNEVSGEDEIVERDPTGRFVRYNHLIGRGATKRVYKAFDLHDGIEVAWNQIDINPADSDPDNTNRLFEEISLLKKLKHKRIMSFYDWFYDAKHRTLNFMTEYFPSGTLRQFRKRFNRVVTVSIIKRWAWQILEGLVYLHGHYPPIIHRDVKADNIFVNSTSGQVKIGDLGLATAHKGLSVVGTPEFMAPEVYDEKYDEKADIYSFGMCLLELATSEYPYAECRGIAQIYRRVSQGIPPAGLEKITDRQLREFIDLCISFHPESRPSARQLLRHSFFDEIRPDVCRVSNPVSPTGTASTSPNVSFVPDAALFPDISPTGSMTSVTSPIAMAATPSHAQVSAFAKCQDNTISFDLSRSMHGKFGDESGMMDGTSSDDEVLIPVAVLRPSKAGSYFRSWSDNTTMQRSADAATQAVDSEQHDSADGEQPNGLVLIRRKLLEDSRMAAEVESPWLRVNSL